MPHVQDDKLVQDCASAINAKHPDEGNPPCCPLLPAVCALALGPLSSENERHELFH